MQKGQICFSLAGRDKGKPLAVVEIADGYVFTADGKERPLENPKRKNPKHLRATDSFLKTEQLRSNKALKSALKPFSEIVVKED